MIYFYNHNEMTVMDRKSGKTVHKKYIIGDKPYFLLDTQSNIVQVNRSSKRFSVFNIDMDYSIETVFDDCYSGVYATFDNHLALVNTDKKFLVYV